MRSLLRGPVEDLAQRRDPRHAATPHTLRSGGVFTKLQHPYCGGPRESEHSLAPHGFVGSIVPLTLRLHTGGGGGVWFQDISDTKIFYVSRRRRQLLQGGLLWTSGAIWWKRTSRRA